MFVSVRSIATRQYPQHQVSTILAELIDQAVTHFELTREDAGFYTLQVESDVKLPKASGFLNDRSSGTFETWYDQVIPYLRNRWKGECPEAASARIPEPDWYAADLRAVYVLRFLRGLTPPEAVLDNDADLKF